MSAARTDNANGWILPVALLGGGYLLYEKVLKPQVIDPVKLKTYTARLRVNMPTVRFKGDNVEFDVYIQNPNSTPLTIKAVVGDVFVLTKEGQNIKIGNVDNYKTVVIKPTAETKYTFAVRLKFINEVALFSSVFAGKVSGLMLLFNGSVNVNGRVWPIRESVKISG